MILNTKVTIVNANLLQAQLLEAQVDGLGLGHFLVRELVHPHALGLSREERDLGGDPNLLAIDPGFPDALADLDLVAIEQRRVQQAAPGLECGDDGVDAAVAVHRGGAEAGLGHLAAALGGEAERRTAANEAAAAAH